MRVVSGSAKGIQLDSVPGESTRPILDRVKTALFDILRPELAGKSILDLFAGSGSVGIEALSQGAEHAVFVDLEKKAVAVIKGNLEKTRLTSQAEVRHTDAFGYLKKCAKSFDYIFIAPPQYKGLWGEALRAIAERPELLTKSGTIIVQIDPKEDERLEFRDFELLREKVYGNTKLLFFRRQSGPPAEIK